MLTTLFALTCINKTFEVPFEYIHGHLVVQAKVNGKTQRLALDSAVGGHLQIDSGLAKELSLPRLGKTESSDGTRQNVTMVDVVRVERISIGPVELENVEAVSRDFKRELGDQAFFDGVLGARCFKGFLLTIDYPGKKLRIAKGALPKADGKSILSLKEVDGIFRIPLKVAGKDIEANLDTGSPLGLIMPFKDSGRLPLVSEPKVVGKAKTLHNTINVYQAQLNGDIEIGGFRLPDRNVTLFDVFETPNLGNGVLSQFEVTLDLAQKLIQLKKL